MYYKSRPDLGTAKITYLHIPEYLDTITFHCQQTVEKYLKSFLIFHSTQFKFTHDLIYLLEIIIQIDSDFEIYFDKLAELHGFAVEIRYPNEIIFLSNEKVEYSINLQKTSVR